MERVMISCVATLLVLAAFVYGQDPDCPFTSGSCPVTLDNVVGVYFHDITDDESCQIECSTISDCNYFTMFGVNDEPIDHKKCFLFYECDTTEPCPECTTGPQSPPIGDCQGNGNYTCETSLTNIVNLYYFDPNDSFSCPDHCKDSSECNFWTEYTYNNGQNMKCYLYRNCNIHEQCNTCNTGTKPT